MTTLTVMNLEEILNIREPRALVWQPHLSAAMAQFEINTPLRAAAFIAQIGHESGRMVFVKEIWNPAQIPAQRSYEGAARLGNTVAGDGERYMGRGLMQITGRKNYKTVSDALGVDFIAQPRMLERPDYAALSAAWFWHTGAGLNLGKRARAALIEFDMGDGVNLNDLADIGAFETITLCINGGLNGYEDRCKLYARAKKILSPQPDNIPSPLTGEG